MFRSSIFTGFPKMHERCPTCGLKFEREPGYFLGAMYVSYGLALVTIVVLERSGPLVQLPAPVAVSGIADWRFWAVLIGVAFAAGLIAMASAQVTVLRWLARMP